MPMGLHADSAQRVGDVCFWLFIHLVLLCTYAVQCHLLAALTPLVPSSVQIRLSPATCLQFLCMVPPCRASFPERNPLKNELRCSINCIIDRHIFGQGSCMISLPVCLSVCLSICLSVYLIVCLSDAAMLKPFQCCVSHSSLNPCSFCKFWLPTFKLDRPNPC